jgi:hypothetical protein
MSRLIEKSRIWVITACLLAFTLSSSTAFAWGHHFGGRGRWWWWPGWFGWGVAATAVTAGAIVGSLPHGYTTVVVGGEPYYYYDDIYYRPAPGGYVVVQEPAPVAVVQEPMPAQVNVAPVQESVSDTIVINVPNAKGGYTPVQLTRHGGGYIGPQGEYYEHPTVKQLKALYDR